MLLSVLGLPVDLTFDSTIDEQSAKNILQSWSWCALPTTTNAEPLRVQAGLDGDGHHEVLPGVRRISGSSLAALEQQLAARLTLLGIEAQRKDLLMWHAVGVSNDDGDVAVLTAPSGTGKTTAARELGRHFGYVSDETVAVTPQNTVLKYQKPLSVIERSGEPKVQLGPEKLGLRQPVADLKPRFLALLNRVDSYDLEPRVDVVATEDALFELVQQISYLADTPGGLKSVLQMVDLCGGVSRITYKEAVDLVPCVHKGLQSETQPVSWVALTGWVPSVQSANEGDAKTSRVGLSEEIDDLVQVNGVMIALVRGTLIRLDGIAPTVVRLLMSGALTGEELTEGLIAKLGAPEAGDAQELTDKAVDELLNRGLLARSR